MGTIKSTSKVTKIELVQQRDSRHYAKVEHYALGTFFVYGFDRGTDGQFYTTTQQLLTFVRDAMSEPSLRHRSYPPGPHCCQACGNDVPLETCDEDGFCEECQE